MQAAGLGHPTVDWDGDDADAAIVTPFGAMGPAIARGPPIGDRHSETDAHPGQRAELRPIGRIGVEVRHDDSAHCYSVSGRKRILRLTAIGMSGEVAGPNLNIDRRAALTTRGDPSHAHTPPRQVLLAPVRRHGACRPDAG